MKGKPQTIQTAVNPDEKADGNDERKVWQCGIILRICIFVIAI